MLKNPQIFGLFYLFLWTWFSISFMEDDTKFRIWRKRRHSNE